MLTYGFYNSRNHDRKYDAVQMSKIFDGIINDGVYMSIGDRFHISAGNGMNVIVGTGRAWFDHTWTLNDSPYPISIPQSEPTLTRIDAVVLEVNANLNARVNTIKVIKGTPSTSPERPTMVKTRDVHQYPLAYIQVNGGVTSFRTADITIAVGTSETPYVTGIIQTVSVDSILNQWRDQMHLYFLDKQIEWDEWITEHREKIENISDEWERMWREWFYNYINENQTSTAEWQQASYEAFTTWFQNIQNQLDGDVAGSLANDITELRAKITEIEAFMKGLQVDQMIYDHLEAEDEDGDLHILRTEQNEPLVAGTKIYVQETIMSKIWPVGSIYISVNNTNPSLLFGGSWEIYEEGSITTGAFGSVGCYLWKRVNL